ncbi:hypothetical protein GCM10018952_74370 [Streptosporangium vulgare]
MEAVLQAFAAERLLTLAADTVEISHEVLLRAWAPAQRGMAGPNPRRPPDPHPAARRRRRMAPSRDPSYLYTGSLLETAAQRLADPAFPLPLTPAEHEFLAASTRASSAAPTCRRATSTILVVLVALLATATIIVQRSQQAAVDQRGRLHRRPAQQTKRNHGRAATSRQNAEHDRQQHHV